MLILGIDPGTATTGFGLIEILNKKVKVREWGLIETKKDVNVAQRLNSIYQKTLSLIKNNKPDIFAIEKIFFATNAKTAIAVGQAQGVMLLASAKLNVPVVEYAPGTIKKVVSGNGRAKKKEVQRSLRKVFGNHVKSKAHKKTHFDNAADALAIALTHARLITQGRWNYKVTTFKIGLVKHYFDKIGVCVVNLTGSVSVGDRIKFTRGGEDMFEQKVTSLQSEHKQLPEAKKGDTVGIKVDSPVKEGAEVYKV